MDFHLTEDHQKIREVCRHLATDFATRTAQHDRDTSLPLENYAALKREGLYGLTVPRELGGWGAGFLGWTVAAEELAQGCPTTALSFNMHVAAVETLMDDPQVPPRVKHRTAAFVLKEQKLLAYSVTEPGGSSLVLGASYAPSVQARRVRDGYVLDGRKAFQSMVEGCDSILMLVHPAEDANPMAGMLLLVPYPIAGQHIEEVWDTLGMRGTRSNNLVLKDCVVPEERLCCQIADFATWFATSPMWGLGFSYTPVYLGIGAAAYRWCCETVKQRVPRGFTQPLSYHPDIRGRVAEMNVDLEAARLLMYQAAWMFDTLGMTPATLTACFRAKYFIGEAVTRITRSALTAGGAHALFKTSPLEQCFRDGASAPIMPPQSDFCRDAVGMFELGLEPTEMLPPLKMAK